MAVAEQVTSMDGVPCLSVIAPCFNEEGNIPSLVGRLHRALEKVAIPYELMLVDDGSSDDTWAVMQQAAAHDPRVRVLRHPANRGMYHAWLSGLQAAHGELVCIIDADLQNPPEAIGHLLDAYRQTPCHIVQGTRSSIEWDRDSRYIASRAFNAILNVAFGDSATDNKSGFVLGPRAVMLDVLSFRRSYAFPQSFIRVAARAKGYRVIEVETLFQPRVAGTSFLAARSRLLTYASAMRDVGTALGEFRRGEHHPVDVRPTQRKPSLSVDPESPVRFPREPLRARVRRRAYFATMPMHAWLIRPRVRKIYDELRSTQWLSAAELDSLQVERLQRLLWHSYVHVPYYRRVMLSAGVSPADIRSLNDLQRIPLLSKADVTENVYFDLFSATHSKRDMHKISTSGSTGQPFVTYADRQQLEIRFATTLRALEWTGWRWGDRQVRLWHQKIGMTRSQVVRERIDAWFMRRTFVPAFELSEAGLADFVDLLNQKRPALLDGYAESLNFLAAYLDTGRILEFAPTGVLSSAQVLTSQTRRAIEGALGCRVFDKYGAREFSGIAYQCDSSDDHHVMDESYIVELLVEGRRARPGEVGEVVITDLNNFSFPLIRYRIGDLAVAVDETEPCACGRGLSRIGAITGRTQALVHCANGRWLPGGFFSHFFKDYPHLVALFQVVQEERAAFELRVVRGDHWTEAGWADLLDGLRAFVGDTRIEVEFVDEIPLLATGKRTPVVSKVRVDFQELHAPVESVGRGT